MEKPYLAFNRFERDIIAKKPKITHSIISKAFSGMRIVKVTK